MPSESWSILHGIGCVLYIFPNKTKPLLMQYRKEPENTVAVSISKSMTDMCCLYFAWSVELLRINSSHGRFPLHLYPLCVLLPSTAARYTFWWSWPWKSAGSKLWPIMQPICCCECAAVKKLPSFLVVCWVKTGDSQVSVHWALPSKSFPPALYTCSCENWIWIMEE